MNRHRPLIALYPGADRVSDASVLHVASRKGRVFTAVHKRNVVVQESCAVSVDATGLAFPSARVKR
jgi:hypothetical protein